MSLKELTSEKHHQAESTAFMKAVFNQTLPIDLWIDWTYQKWLFYGTIEAICSTYGLLTDLPDIRRTIQLFDDYRIMNSQKVRHDFRPVTIDYHNYLLYSCNDKDKIFPHLYTWHMGDMFGGQMIKKIVKGSHLNLEFKDKDLLIYNIRSKLNDSMAEEANIAFDWAIKMMEQYDQYLE